MASLAVALTGWPCAGARTARLHAAEPRFEQRIRLADRLDVVFAAQARRLASHRDQGRTSRMLPRAMIDKGHHPSNEVGLSPEILAYHDKRKQLTGARNHDEPMAPARKTPIPDRPVRPIPLKDGAQVDRTIVYPKAMFSLIGQPADLRFRQGLILIEKGSQREKVSRFGCTDCFATPSRYR
jgi:hypothetical protein